MSSCQLKARLWLCVLMDSYSTEESGCFEHKAACQGC